MTDNPSDKAQDKEEPLLPSGEHTALPKDLPDEIPAHLPRPGEDENSGTVKTLLAWKAPGRPFKKRGKEFFLNLLLIILCLEIIAFLFNQQIIMLLIFSVAFLVVALEITPPHDFHYKISTGGITVEDHFFLWQELYDFYFKKRKGIDILHIRTYALIPGELTITLGDIHREHIKSVLLPYLPYREIVRKDFMEKSSDWLSDNFSLEKIQKSKVAS